MNVGVNTDAVAAVADRLAGMFYGIDGIPQEWLHQLARRDYIEELCENFCWSWSQYEGEETG